MSKWKLVPVEWPDTPCPYGSPAHYAQMVAAAPLPPPEVLDAMVERGAIAMAHSDGLTRIDHWHKVMARAAILAALEMTDG